MKRHKCIFIKYDYCKKKRLRSKMGTGRIKIYVNVIFHHHYFLMIQLAYGNKMLTRWNRGFIADFIACSTCFGHHCAHHQELKIIKQWLLPVVFG